MLRKTMPGFQMRGGWIGRVLIVLVVLMVLAVLIIPTFSHPFTPSSNHNLKEILTAALVYELDYSLEERKSLEHILPPSTKDDEQMVFVGRRFMLLAKNGELPGKVFKNPLSPISALKEILPGVSLQQASLEQIANCDPAIAKAWASSFAMDYSVSLTEKQLSHRVVLADRDPDIWNGKGACVTYGDGHGVFLKKITKSTSSRTMRLRSDGTLEAVPYSVIANDFGVNDNIYAPDENLGETAPGIWTVGGGSATACWVR